MPAADRPSRATPGGRANGNGHGGARKGTNPVVPARREQRIERSPATVVRQAGEVRGRPRPEPMDPRDDSWSLPLDRAVPLAPSVGVDPTLGFDADVLDADMVEVIEPVTGPITTAVPVGDITYDRAPAWPLEPAVDDRTTARPLVTGPVVPAVEPPATAPAPATAAPPPPGRPRRSLFRRRTRIRRVSRVVRRVDAWSVLKVSIIFYAVAYVVLLVAGVLLWNLAQTTGTVENVEGFVRELFGLEVFRIDGERLYRASWPIGVFLAVAGTGLNVTAAVMFNLITDLVGGVRVTVLEEEVRVVESGHRQRVGRRPRAPRPGPPAEAPTTSTEAG